MKKQINLIFFLSTLQQFSWGHEQKHFDLTFTSIQDLSLELFTNIETAGEKSKVVKSQRIRVDSNGLSFTKEINGIHYIPSFKKPHYPLVIQIIPGSIPYNIHVSACYTAIPLSESKDNMSHSILYKGVVINQIALTTPIPREITVDQEQNANPLRSLDLSLWPTQLQVQSTFMSGTRTIATEFKNFLTMQGNYLQIAPSVIDLSPNGLSFMVNLQNGSIEVEAISE